MNRNRSTLKYALLTGALLFSSTFTPAFSFMDDAGNASNQATTASRLLQSGRYEEALESFKQASTSSNDRYLKGLTLSDCGECCLKLKRYSQAREYFTQAYPLLNGGKNGIGSRETNVCLVRWGLAEFALGNNSLAQSKIKQAIDNSLGIWTYNYSDLSNAASYVQALVMIANAHDGSGGRWYQYGVYELSRLIAQGGNRAVVAQIALSKLQNYGQSSNRSTPPVSRQQSRPRSSSDPYLFSSGQYAPSRARYGLNGTQDYFMQNTMRTQSW